MFAIFIHLGLGGALLLLLWAWAVLDCISTDSMLCRNLPKGTWIFLLIFIPPLGALCWLLLGRPEGAGSSLGGRRSGYEHNPYRMETRGYEDRPSWQGNTTASQPKVFAEIDGESQAVRERKLLEWEAELKKREDALKEADSGLDQPVDPELPEGQ